MGDKKGVESEEMLATGGWRWMVESGTNLQCLTIWSKPGLIFLAQQISPNFFQCEEGHDFRDLIRDEKDFGNWSTCIFERSSEDCFEINRLGSFLTLQLFTWFSSFWFQLWNAWQTYKVVEWQSKRNYSDTWDGCLQLLTSPLEC